MIMISLVHRSGQFGTGFGSLQSLPVRTTTLDWFDGGPRTHLRKRSGLFQLTPGAERRFLALPRRTDMGHCSVHRQARSADVIEVLGKEHAVMACFPKVSAHFARLAACRPLHGQGESKRHPGCQPCVGDGHLGSVACVLLIAAKFGREAVSAQRGVVKHSCSAWVGIGEVAGGEGGEFG